MRRDRTALGVVGAVEEIRLPELGLSLSCRIDTGARTSALHVESLEDGGAEVVFVVASVRDSERRRRRFSAEVVRHARVRASNGGTEHRPIVELVVALGSERFPVEVGLTDRGDMRHPMLLGRNALAGRYLVDVSRSHVQRSARGRR